MPKKKITGKLNNTGRKKGSTKGKEPKKWLKKTDVIKGKDKAENKVSATKKKSSTQQEEASVIKKTRKVSASATKTSPVKKPSKAAKKSVEKKRIVEKKEIKGGDTMATPADNMKSENMEAALSRPISRSGRAAGIPCICIKRAKYWYCMKQLPDGSLVQCDGPFKTEFICLGHRCL